MTTGDPKQAIILSVVAVGAIGFVVFRMIPRGETPVGIATSPRQVTTDTTADQPKKFPTVVLSNAFWHPKIGERPIVTTPPSTGGTKRTPNGSGSVRPETPFDGLSGQLPPVGNTGENQQLKEGPKIRLDAIIGTDGKREALLSFGTDELHKAYVGSKFADVAVVAITDTTVRIRIGKKEHVIAVGEEKQL